ncbi:MAG: winged helix-turn-helix transcriptional regulator [Nanoarchaeota archaeon]
MINKIKEDFFNLLIIQTKIYEQNRTNTHSIFEDGLNILNIENKSLALKTDQDLDKNLRNKAQDWLNGEGFLIGLTAFKQIFWNGYFRALIPYIIKEYISRGYSARGLQDKISDMGVGVNGYLCGKYPQIKDLLGFQKQSYKEMLIELRKKDINEQFGYFKNPEEVEEFKIIPKSVIIDLAKQIEKSKSEINEKEILKTISKYKGKMTQKEIAQKIGKSQQTVSRLMKKGEYYLKR